MMESLLIKACILAVIVAIAAMFQPVTPGLVVIAMVAIGVGEVIILLRDSSG